MVARARHAGSPTSTSTCTSPTASTTSTTSPSAVTGAAAVARDRRWLDGTLRPARRRAASRAMGHIPGPLVFQPDDPLDLARASSTAPPPRASPTATATLATCPRSWSRTTRSSPTTSACSARTSSSTASLRVLGRDGGALRAAVAADRARRPARCRFVFARAATPDRWSSSASRRARALSRSPAAYGRVDGQARDVRAAGCAVDRVATSVAPPAAYWVPAAWRDVIERLDAARHPHGAPRRAARSRGRLCTAWPSPKSSPTPFEGHVRVTATRHAREAPRAFPGGLRARPHRPAPRHLAVLLLEPASADSFFQWGFFTGSSAHRVRRGLHHGADGRAHAGRGPEARGGVRAKVETDAAFAASPAARLQWLYQRTPFYDERARLYPVGREE